MPDTKAAKPSVSYGVRLALICLASLMILAYCFANKAELHNDEYTSYIIANNSGEGGMQFAPQDHFLYETPAQPFLSAMTVAPGQGFHYDTVVKNDAADTLPPLYYMLLHTVCSFFPGQFSIWFGGVINMLLQVMSILLLSQLMRLLGLSEEQRLLSCLCFAVLPGVIEIAQFLRMYSLGMFVVIWLTYEEIKWLKTGVFGVKQAVSIALPTMVGVLSHYYFVLFAAFQCLTIGVYLLASKRFKTFGFYGLTFAVAAGLTIAVYPGILHQVFGGWLTPTAVDNLTTGGDMFERLKGFYFVINIRLFGGYLPEMALAILIALLLCWRPRFQRSLSVWLTEGRFMPWLCIALPSGLYAVLITKIAFYTNTRYMSFIYPLIVMMGVEALIRLVSLCPGGHKPLYGLTALLCAVALLSANQLYPMEDREYSGDVGGRLIERCQQHCQLSAVCVYTYPWQAENTYNLNKSLSGLVFTKQDALSELPQCLSADRDALLVEIETSMDAEAILDQLYALYPSLSTAEELGDCAFFHTYLLT